MRDRKADLDKIRYAQGALDMQDVLIHTLTYQNIRDWRVASYEEMKREAEENQRDRENS